MEMGISGNFRKFPTPLWHSLEIDQPYTAWIATTGGQLTACIATAGGQLPAGIAGEKEKTNQGGWCYFTLAADRLNLWLRPSGADGRKTEDLESGSH